MTAAGSNYLSVETNTLQKIHSIKTHSNVPIVPIGLIGGWRAGEIEPYGTARFFPM